MAATPIRFAGRRRRAIGHLDLAAGHASSPGWELDGLRRDAVSFRLILVAKLARDVDRPDDIAEDDWAWLRDLVRFGSVHEPAPAEFARVVGDELPGVLDRLRRSLEG